MASAAHPTGATRLDLPGTIHRPVHWRVRHEPDGVKPFDPDGPAPARDRHCDRWQVEASRRQRSLPDPTTNPPTTPPAPPEVPTDAPPTAGVDTKRLRSRVVHRRSCTGTPSTLIDGQAVSWAASPTGSSSRCDRSWTLVLCRWLPDRLDRRRGRGRYVSSRRSHGANSVAALGPFDLNRPVTLAPRASSELAIFSSVLPTAMA